MSRISFHRYKSFIDILRPKSLTLIFFAFVLTFSAAMPTQVMAIWPFDPPKRNPSVLPASEINTASTQAIQESGGGISDTLKKKPDRTKAYEIESLRTPFTSTYKNKDGTKTMEYSFDQQNYKVGNKWEKIDNTLKAVTNPVKSLNLLEQLTNTAPEPEVTKYTGKGGVINAQMKPLGEGLDITVGDKTINMKPLGANDAKPTQKDARTVVYKNAWDGVDLEYELRGESVKEVIILKKKVNNPVFDFKITGGKVIQHPTKTGLLTVEGMPEDFTFSSLTVDVNERGVISEERASQVATKDGIQISLDKEWLKSLKTGDFPIRIDPSFGRDATNYLMRKNDGYSCGSSNCYANTGTLMDGTWRHWRTYFHFPFTDMAGKTILNANLHGFYKTGVGGTGEARTIWMGHAGCLNNFHCYAYDVGATGGIGGDFDINFTGGMQNAVNTGDWGRWWALHGEEGPYKSFKPYWNLQAGITYDTPTPMTTPIEPADNQVMVNTQPSLKVNAVGDADGDPVQYYFQVSTGVNGTGAVINSGWIGSNFWTVPDGILQDGTTYYWRVLTRGNQGVNPTYPNWNRSFKIDLRTGKDSTQAYDTVGPVGVALATGNATTSTGTHSMSALGGSIGLNLDYDSPAKTKKGLIGEYWNVPANNNFSNGVPTATPNLTRNDQDVNFDWSSDSPSPGVIGNDWFYVRWKGYFTAPVTGTYTFGSAVDDNADVYINNQLVASRACCTAPGTPDYTGSTPVSLQAGQVVPIRIQYQDATSFAYAKVYVKGAVPEQSISRDWLNTEVKATPAQYGLVGRYFTDDGSHNFPGNDADPLRLMMARTDSKLSFNWGTGGPAPGLQGDNFMVRWTGYVTVPTTGSYTFGAFSDDGVRIKLNNGLLGAEQTVLNSWQAQGATLWGSATNLVAGQQVPITVEYFEQGGGAAFTLRIQGPGYSDQEIPVSWLTPKASVLPDAWRLGVDVDGDISYERLRVVGQDVVLEDSTRSTHTYTWTGGGYKPPVNEDGQLTRNADNTFTLLDVDGRVYVFDAEGKLRSLTTPMDDRNPASLKYIYGGSPSRLERIEDGVTSSRYGTLHYKGVNEDGNCSVPGGFDDAPTGMLCAFKTSDGDITKLYYKQGQLSRVEKPGEERSDFGYDSLGRIVSMRDSLANDAVTANIRNDDASVLTEVSYDQLGRASTVIAPAPTTNASRVNHSFEYLPGVTQMHIAGAPEPHGFSKRIEYDSLLRTIKNTDVTNLTAQTEWDPVKDLELSKTDATGLKSTTIYDKNDLAIENYGPAPTSWYGTDRRPLSNYVNQTPKTTTGYDEGIVGPAVSWYNYKAKPDTSTAAGSGGTLVGSPRLYATGVNASSGILSTDIASPPVAYDTGYTGLGFRMSGKLYLPNGTYWINAQNTEGVRVWVDDQLVIDSWQDAANRSLSGGSFTVANGDLKRFRVDTYRKNGSTGNFGLWMKQDYGFDWTNNWSQWLKPDYNLKTSETAYDSQLGNVTTTTTYNKPEYGTVDKTTLDPAGLNLQTTSTYEAPGAGFLRQTSKTLPGGGTTIYQHYAANESRDNPCTVDVEAIHQGGRPKGKVEADPDGAGSQTSRTSETVYNTSGEVVATKYNNDDWTCTTYDARGRVQSTIVPALGSKPGRTITNDYAVDGNPLITSTNDGSGLIKVENDLLGRTVKYTDAKGKMTENTYDMYGKLTQRISPIGTETYEYDNYDRLTVQKLDSVTFATATYDQFSRLATVQYPAGISLSGIMRDTLGRENGTTFTVNGQTYTDSIERYVSGDIKQGTENGVSKSYSYDNASRLTGATIGSNTFAYEFGTPDTSCSSIPGYNANTAKNGNRTKLTMNGQVTTYCYDMADRLISSSDVTLTDAQYDSRGNTVSLGDTTHKTEFGYDASDRNTSIKAGDKETVFTRDAQDRIIGREHKINGTTESNVNYGFTGSGDSPDFLLDTNGDVTQKYLTLPGDVIVTIKPNSTSAGATTYSLPNIHGDIYLTVDADGLVKATHQTGPFGEALPNQTNPANTAAGTSWSYVGQHQKITDGETGIITGGVTQMGARVYVPILGRFLSVDPVEGGTPNNYVYALDSVNQYDLSGKAIPLVAVLAVIQVVGVISAGYDYYKKPTKANAFWLGLALVPGAGLVKNVPKAVKWGLNGASALRIGHTSVKVGNYSINLYLQNSRKPKQPYKPTPLKLKLNNTPYNKRFR